MLLYKSWRFRNLDALRRLERKLESKCLHWPSSITWSVVKLHDTFIIQSWNLEKKQSPEKIKRYDERSQLREVRKITTILRDDDMPGQRGKVLEFGC
ncbi:hypothetical protein AAES_165118 [Amazona aestiva]|uniref:Uncharacterized protein n=1 Tax=Amazona aestiva TaxID=12930 RepID=A0A0Q3QL36_AMAAE|nr:hypothetical protein AAES_165118 [Amazona aestiva]